MNCSERKDLIFLFAADALDDAEAEEVRRHLATGCPQCVGVLAESQALLAQLPLGMERVSPRPELRKVVLNRIHAETLPRENIRMHQDRIGPTPLKSTRSWESSVIPASLAAILAVAVTLLTVHHFGKSAGSENPDDIIAILNFQVQNLQTRIAQTAKELDKLQSSVEGIKIATLTGPLQPDAVGRVFVDVKNSKWYFFTSGMKPPEDGKIYELWLISDKQKIPAGTFNVNEHGTATLLGAVPPLPAGAAVSMAVTDEPAGGTTQPTGHAQISGSLQ